MTNNLNNPEDERPDILPATHEIQPLVYNRDDISRKVINSYGEHFINPDTDSDGWRTQWEADNGVNVYLFGGDKESSSWFALEVWTLESDGQHLYCYNVDGDITYQQPRGTFHKNLTQHELEEDVKNWLGTKIDLTEEIQDPPIQKFDDFDRIAGRFAVENALSMLDPNQIYSEIHPKHSVDEVMSASALYKLSQLAEITVDEELFRTTFSEIVAENLRDTEGAQPIQGARYYPLPDFSIDKTPRRRFLFWKRR